ncbi:hypothetical protein OOT00_11625 [Desulfobotulus sp. H1]|uniref:Uncharacterized protein n=1 Tax=Desulfobotulus pelophilus TaxID=2823377 RepID=A0ABT3NAY5_9BACT|nr:hypothetical protein [Desulfobotulus pelophilus]MCW7754634.1 hypothetical protein [Desulfobotulus pelophilus]
MAKLWKVLCLVSMLGMLGMPVLAGDEEVWQSIFNNIPSEKEIIKNELQTGRLYNATVVFTVEGVQGDNGVLRESDTIDLTLEGRGVAPMSFRGTKEDLVIWAETNRTALFKAVFGNAPDVAASGMTSTQSLAQSAFMSSVYMAPNTRTGMGAVATDSGGAVSFIPVSNKDIVISGQHDRMKIGDDKATGSSGIMAYEWRFGDSMRHSAGISIPYRQLDVDDSLDTEYKHAAMMPFFKKRWYRSNGVLEWMVNGTLGVTYLKSKVFTDGGGYLEYGGGTGIRYSHALTANAIVNAGIMYQGLKKEIPSDLVPDEVRWISDALNDLPWEHNVIPSVGTIVNLMDGRLTLKGEVFRVHQVQNEVVDGYEYQTVVFGMATVRPWSWFSCSLGYKESFELKDITDRSYIIDFTITW